MKRKRVMMYFINAADELIKEKGIGNITLREVASRAGYNSATIYNYFENLDHLIFFGAMRNIKDYSQALKTNLKNVEDPMDTFFIIWECFCDCSFEKPEIYNAIFFPDLKDDVEDYVEEYYKIFPEDLLDKNKTVSTMLIKRDITKRGLTTILDLVRDGYIKSEDADKLNDMTLLIHEGMLKRVLRGKESKSQASLKTMDYIKSIVKSMLIKEYNFHYKLKV